MSNAAAGRSFIERRPAVSILEHSVTHRNLPKTGRASAVKQRQIYPVIFISQREFRPIRVVKQTREEQHRAVLPVRHHEAVPSLLFQKCYNSRLIGIIVLDLPA